MVNNICIFAYVIVHYALGLEYIFTFTEDDRFISNARSCLIHSEANCGRSDSTAFYVRLCAS